ncbi:hypothetical protein WA026_003015, partial [Henosepilachna vigintioctopunctata]
MLSGDCRRAYPLRHDHSLVVLIFVIVECGTCELRMIMGHEISSLTGFDVVFR